VVVKTESEYRNLIKGASLSDLTKKISVRVRSNSLISTNDNSNSTSVDYSSVIQSSSDITVSGVDYLFYEDRQNIYALGFVNIKDLKENYRNEALLKWNNILEVYDSLIPS
jgi:hypothetical protein